MKYKKYFIKCKILIYIIISIILQLSTQTISLNQQIYQPSFINMSFIYFKITYPNQLNSVICFILGLILDTIFHYTLGIHSLSFIIINYLMINKINSFYKKNIKKQILIIILLLLIIQFIINMDELYIYNAKFITTQFYHCIIDGTILWILIYKLHIKTKKEFIKINFK
ncbi:MAG: cell shape determining protein MreD [Candidatus Westeberhardia cardiocondylae]|nr:cell shape determining protein MreD [Candidatus Westeberhardia cardiocondylae]